MTRKLLLTIFLSILFLAFIMTNHQFANAVPSMVPWFDQITDVIVTGTITGIVNAPYTFSATSFPPGTTLPITYVWQATDQLQVTHTGGGLYDTATFLWNVVGDKVITVTATNISGTVTGNYVVAIGGSASGPDLGLSQMASTPAAVGSPLTYTLWINNHGTDVATGVIVTDTLPMNVTFVSADPGCNHNAGVVTCALGSLSPSFMTTAQIVVTPLGAGWLWNNAQVGANEADVNPMDNIAGTGVNVTLPGPDLGLSKWASSPGPVPAGVPLTYTLQVNNHGTVEATGVVVTDTLPLNVAFVLASPGCNHNAGVVTCALGSLSPSFMTTAQIVVTPLGAGYLWNSAQVGANEADVNPMDNIAGAGVNVNLSGPDLGISQWASNPATVGSPLTFTLSANNHGTETATGVMVTDTLPLNVTFVSASPGCNHSSGIVTCALGILSPSSMTTTLIVVTPLEAGYLWNNAQVGANEVDTDLMDNIAGAGVNVTVPGLDVSVSKSLDGLPFPGSLGTYQISYRNAGNTFAPDVVITDTLPVNVTYVSSSGGQVCDPMCHGVALTPTVIGNQVMWSLGTLANSPTANTINMNVRISDEVSVGDTLTNVVRISTSGVDTNSNNNVFTHTTSIAAATLCVDPTGAGGCYTTIEAAINAASPGHTISIVAGTYYENLTVNKPLIFIGAGTDRTIVDGGGAGRVFNIASGDASFFNLTVQNGHVVDGQGGGIYASAALTLTNVNILSNTASTSGFNDTSGGGVYARGALNLVNVNVLNNAISGYVGNGGGIYAGGATIVSDSVFQNNQCPSCMSGGGGLHASSTLVLTDTQFLSNTAGSSGGGAWVGGSAALSGGLFQGNISHGWGGGLAAYSDLALTNTLFLGNTADGSGGGAYGSGRTTLDGGMFQNNNAGGQGGGLYTDSTLALMDTQFLHNTASGDGGGASASGAVILSGGVFQNNTSNSSCGGLDANNGLTMTATQFLSNTSTDSGGGACVAGAATLFGGVFQNNVGGAVGAGGGLYAWGTLTATGTRFLSNTGGVGGGAYACNETNLIGGVFQDNVGGSGGGLYVWQTLALTDTQFLSNTAAYYGGARALTATLSGGVFQNNVSTSSNGGGLYVRDLVQTGTQFFNNTAALEGNDAYVWGEAILFGGVFQNNGTGTGLYVDHLTVSSGYPLTIDENMELRGDLINNGELILASGTVTFSGGSPTLSGTVRTAFNNLAVNSGVTLTLGVTPTVEGMLINNGMLSQTLEVGPDSPTRFLNITNSAGGVTKYKGVDITSTLGLSATSVSVQGNASACTNDVGSPLYVKRCFKITPTSDNPATITLWALASEQNGITLDNLAIYRFALGTWQKLTGISGTDGGDYVFVQATTPGFSSFLLGDTANSPTAVTLQDFRAQTAGLDIGLLCAALVVGALSLSVSKLALARRKQRQMVR